MDVGIWKFMIVGIQKFYNFLNFVNPNEQTKYSNKNFEVTKQLKFVSEILIKKKCYLFSHGTQKIQQFPCRPTGKKSALHCTAAYLMKHLEDHKMKPST